MWDFLPPEAMRNEDDTTVETARWGDVHTCDSCNHEVSGCTAQALIADGWRWQPIPYRSHEYFVMCDECVDRFKRRREARELLSTVDVAHPRKDRD